MQFKKLIWILIILANLANIADIISTLIALNSKQSLYESMFISKLLIGIHPLVFIVVKFLVVLTLTIFLGIYFQKFKKRTKYYNLFIKGLIILILLYFIYYFTSLALSNIYLLL